MTGKERRAFKRRRNEIVRGTRGLERAYRAATKKHGDDIPPGLEAELRAAIGVLETQQDHLDADFAAAELLDDLRWCAKNIGALSGLTMRHFAAKGK